jgi:hypothetical protein
VAGTLKRETRYARSGDVNIAYQVFGEGERHLVLVPGWVSNVEAGSLFTSAPHALKGVPGEWRLYAVDRGTSGV